MYLGHKKLRDDLRDKVAELEKITSVPEKREACRRWLDTYDRGGENEAATAALIARLEADPDCPYTRVILPKKDYLAKKSVWIFGGDGWACDIGCGGLDHGPGDFFAGYNHVAPAEETNAVQSPFTEMFHRFHKRNCAG